VRMLNDHDLILKAVIETIDAYVIMLTCYLYFKVRMSGLNDQAAGHAMKHVISVIIKMILTRLEGRELF
jgi:hypothetical protein